MLRTKRQGCESMANNAEKPNIFKRIGLFFCRMGKGIAKAFKNMFFEL